MHPPNTLKVNGESKVGEWWILVVEGKFYFPGREK